MTTADPQAVLAAALARAPGLVPGWEPAPGSAGRALLEVAARFAGALGEAAAQVPDRTRLAFLESTGLNLLPAQPAPRWCSRCCRTARSASHSLRAHRWRWRRAATATRRCSPRPRP